MSTELIIIFALIGAFVVNVCLDAYHTAKKEKELGDELLIMWQCIRANTRAVREVLKDKEI